MSFLAYMVEISSHDEMAGGWVVFAGQGFGQLRGMTWDWFHVVRV